MKHKLTLREQQRGGLRTKEFHGMDVCPTCGRAKLNDFFRTNATKGGMKCVEMYGVDHMREIGKLGGRPRK
ncbi:MAG: hypothetical protein PHQ43_00270 [Dehalococcoidales bacterium]|nr:hypothetical protein [Dehalococcoidales bacterium]